MFGNLHLHSPLVKIAFARDRKSQDHSQVALQSVPVVLSAPQNLGIMAVMCMVGLLGRIQWDPLSLRTPVFISGGLGRSMFREVRQLDGRDQVPSMRHKEGHTVGTHILSPSTPLHFLTLPRKMYIPSIALLLSTLCMTVRVQAAPCELTAPYSTLETGSTFCRRR